MFPLGTSTKAEVREIAGDGLTTAKKDSTGICLLVALKFLSLASSKRS